MHVFALASEEEEEEEEEMRPRRCRLPFSPTQHVLHVDEHKKHIRSHNTTAVGSQASPSPPRTKFFFSWSAHSSWTEAAGGEP